MRSYGVWFLIILGLNVLYLGVSRWTASHKGEERPRTYDDVVAADPSAGDKIIRESAERGNAKDESYVGTWYYGGLEGYPKDFGEAAKWLRKAADQGDSGSQVLLGKLYLAGNGVVRDTAQAVNWFQKAADQGDPNGCAAIGSAYEKGVAGSILKDPKKAIEWYKKAGDNPFAKASLARLGAK